jgi:hypothetical protein
VNPHGPELDGDVEWQEPLDRRRGGDYIAWIEDDVLVSEDWLAARDVDVVAGERLS